jgi:sialidase-1
MTWFRYGDATGRHAIAWAYRMGSGTTPQLWIRAEPADRRIRALICVDRFNVSVQSDGAYNDGRWHHLALQRSAGSLRMYVDGSMVAAKDAPPGSLTAGKEFGVDGFHLGQRLDGGDRFHGFLDELRVYRRALSPSQLDEIRLHNHPVRGELGLRLPMESIVTAATEGSRAR